jgi:hypothetical protein
MSLLSVYWEEDRSATPRAFKDRNLREGREALLDAVSQSSRASFLCIILFKDDFGRSEASRDRLDSAFAFSSMALSRSVQDVSKALRECLAPITPDQVVFQQHVQLLRSEGDRWAILQLSSLFVGIDLETVSSVPRPLDTAL